MNSITLSVIWQPGRRRRRPVNGRGVWRRCVASQPDAAPFDRLEKQLGLQQKEDWYQVTTNTLRKVGAVAVLKPYGNSLSHALTVVYPHHRWQPWRFSKAPQRYWKEPAHARRFLESAAQELGLTRLEDWYHVSFEKLRALSTGLGVLSAKRKNGSLVAVLTAAFPEHDWHWWRFQRVPPAFVAAPDAQRAFFQQLAVDLKLPDLGTLDQQQHPASAEQALTDWYKLKLSEITARGGSPIMKRYRWSVALALMSLFPSLPWHPWRFERVPPSWWDNPAHHRLFLEWLGSHLGFELPKTDDEAVPEAWYSLDRSHVRQRGGATMLAHYYNDSVAKALLSVFPAWKWNLWKFPQIPRSVLSGTFSSPRIALRDWFQTYAGPLLGITETDLSSWYRVSDAQLRAIGARNCFLKFEGVTSLPSALTIAYPDHSWEFSRFQMGPGKKSSQKMFKILLQSLFDCDNCVQEDATLESPQGPLTLDLFIASKRLAFEYTSNPSGGTSENDKQALCQREGISLISIPHGSTLSRDSVRGLILSHRRDLVDSIK